MLTKYNRGDIIGTVGGIAQLGERLNGIQEVSGSIPLISTTTEHVCRYMQKRLKLGVF